MYAGSIPARASILAAFERQTDMADMNVAILTTGGTIDKIHDAVAEDLSFPVDGASQMDDILRTSRCHFPRIEQIVQKDSLNFTGADRENILTSVRKCAERHIVITHGTGTMDRTAAFLDGKTGDKTVVLTGAIRPYSLGKSDSEFNIGGAIVAAQILDAGVYAVMNGRVFSARNIVKHIANGRFDLG